VRGHLQNTNCGEGFQFGENWAAFLKRLNPQRIEIAESLLNGMLDTRGLERKDFIDIGCASGLFSLAAMPLNASRVHSIDNDPQIINCGGELHRRFFRHAANLTVDRVDVLDEDYKNSLGVFDIVYSGECFTTRDLFGGS
jgi:predicted RNA methylase